MARNNWIIVASIALTSAGCAFERYSSDPLVRMEQMLIDTENERQIRDADTRTKTNDQPTELTPYRINGGVGPGAPSSI